MEAVREQDGSAGGVHERGCCGRRASLVHGALIAFVAIGLFSLAGRAFSRHGWIPDMIATFAPHFAALCAVGAIAGAAMRRHKLACILAVITAIHVWWLAPGRAPGIGGASGRGGLVRALMLNAHGANEMVDSVIGAVLSAEADVVVIVEVSDALMEGLRHSEALCEAYPFRSLPEPGLEWNIAKLSRWPLEAIDLRDENYRTYLFNYLYRRSHIVGHPDGRFILAAMITRSPRTPSRWRDGNLEIERNLDVIRGYLTPIGLPIVVATDLNATPSGWRSVLVRRAGGLVRAKPLAVFAGTWPAAAPPSLRVAIDDFLVGEGVRVGGWRTLEGSYGSDHVGVVGTLWIPFADRDADSY